MTESTQHSLPDVPDAAVEEAVRAFIEKEYETDISELSPEVIAACWRNYRIGLQRALPSLHAAFEQQPNVLSKEEARLLVDCGRSVEGVTYEYDLLMERLSDWAEEGTTK